MKTFVIRCNDSVEAVVIGDEQFARQEMERRRAAYFELNKWNFRDGEKEYRQRCLWRVDEYDAVVQDGSVQPIEVVRKAARLIEADGVMHDGSERFREAMRVLVNYALYGAPVEVREMAEERARLRAFVESAARCGEYADGEDLEAAVSMLRDDARKLL